MITQFSPTKGVTIPLWFHLGLYPDTSSSFRAMGRLKLDVLTLHGWVAVFEA